MCPFLVGKPERFEYLTPLFVVTDAVILVVVILSHCIILPPPSLNDLAQLSPQLMSDYDGGVAGATIEYWGTYLVNHP